MTLLAKRLRHCKQLADWLILCHVICMVESALIERVRRKLQRLKSVLDERGRRHWAVCEALELGHGGIRAVAQATGLGERTIQRGPAILGKAPL